MDKNTLSSYFWLRNEIKNQKRRLKRLEQRLQRSKEHMIADTAGDYRTGHKRTIVISGESQEQIKLPAMIFILQQEIEKNIEKSEQLVVEIEQYIQTIENAQLRELMRSRFIDCLPWEKVGRVNYVSPDHARKIIRKHLNTIQVDRS